MPSQIGKLDRILCNDSCASVMAEGTQCRSSSVARAGPAVAAARSGPRGGGLQLYSGTRVPDKSVRDSGRCSGPVPVVHLRRRNALLVNIFHRISYEKQIHHSSPSPSDMVVSCLWSFLWLVVLVAVAYPVALLSSIWYILLQPFQVCCSPCLPLAQFFFKLVQLPLICAGRIRDCKPMCGEPSDA